MSHSTLHRPRGPVDGPADGPATSPPPANRSRAAILVVGGTTLLGGAIVTLAGPAMGAFFAVVGLLWGLGLVYATGRLGRRESRGYAWGTAAIFAAVLTAGFLTGSGLHAQIVMNAMLDHAPQQFADFIRGPVGEAEALPFFILNPPLEWLFLPAALLLSWGVPRRRTLVTAAFLLFLANRLWTYLYFAPLILGWGEEGGSGTPMSPDTLDQARFWVDLSWIRLAIDVATTVLLLVALRRRTPPAIERPV